MQRDGIVWDKITYYADTLRPWINASTGRVKQKFVVRRDPTDISKLYVLDPELNEYFEVPYRDLSKPSISIWEYRAAEAYLRDHGITAVKEDEIFEAREAMRRIEEGARKQTKRQRRDRERRKHRAENAVPPLPTPPPPSDRPRDGHLALVVDNTGMAEDLPKRRGKGRPAEEDEFDLDIRDIQAGGEEW